MRVSVVIPTYNRAALLEATIPALMSQRTEPWFDYEVIFVCNGAMDRSQSVLQQAEAAHSGKLRQFYIQPTGGPSAPRNVGIRAATGDVVIIMDDDVLPDSDMVLHHAAFHRAHPEPAFAALGELYVPEEFLRDPMAVFHSFPYDEVRTLGRLRYLHFWTCNVSFKRQFMLDHGMFDESFLYYEDVLCGHKLEAAGMELRFVPAARGQHLHQLKPSGVAAKGTFTGKWLYAFLDRVPDPVAKVRFGVLSRDLPPAVFVRRCLNRVGFSMIDNPLGLGLLKALGAQSERRSRVTDLYHYIVFRRNMLSAYREAGRAAKRPRPAARADASWVDRGEP